MDFTAGVDMFQNGPQNMYYRTVNDGTRDVTVLVDADGKAIQVTTLGDNTNVLFTVANNGTEIDTVTEGSTISREGIINACGGTVNVTALNAGESVFLLVMGTHIQYCNNVDSTTTPSVPGWPIIEIWANEQCTVRPSGETSVVYAQLKKPFGFGGGKTWNQDMAVVCPSDASPNQHYKLYWYVEWYLDNGEQPFTVGVYRLTAPEAINVENNDYSFI